MRAPVTWVVWRTAWSHAWTHRASNWVQVAMMIVNDAIWVLFWALIFREVDSIRGWEIGDVMLLMAIITTSSGVAMGCAHNLRFIGQIASSGGLDAILALPVPPLRHLLASRVETIAIGDAIFGVALFILAGRPTPARTLAFAFGVACAMVIIAGFLIAVGSLGFWTSRTEAGDLGFQAIVLFSIYPVDIFGGLMKFLLYAVVPAGFVTAMPARLVADFDPAKAAIVAAVAAVFGGLGVATFAAGLRRYTSGATWTQP